MVCDLLHIRHKIRMWLRIYDPFVTNISIDKCMNQYNYPWIIHRTLLFFFYPCICPSYSKFALSSINYCNIVVNSILQTRPKWMYEM